MKILINTIARHWLALTSFSLLAITVASLWPAESLPSVPGGDKTHHFIAYGLLMFPVALARPKNWLWLALLFIGWSGAIELIQPYVNRFGEWWDLAANGGGLLCGVLLASLLSKAR